MTFEYAPAPESRSVVDIASSYGLFIDGAMVDPMSGSTFKTVNPATEEVLAEFGFDKDEIAELRQRKVVFLLGAAAQHVEV